MSFGGLQTATAFWSYAHADDEGSDGQIRRLKEKLDHAFKMHRGEALASFFDRTGDHKLEWGEEWRSKISTTISGTTFFIPVISPSYVKSTMCREEFDEFSEKARNSDLNELVLPILWVPVDPETDEERRIFDAAKARQWIDWSQRRKLEESSAPYRALIDEMGERLAKAAKSVASKPEVTLPDSGPGTPDSDGNGGVPDTRDGDTPSPTGGGGGLAARSGEDAASSKSAPGLIDLAAEATTRADSFVANLSTGFQAVRDMSTNVLQPNPLPPQASAGQRMFYFKRIAQEMQPYADRFEQYVERAASDASDLNDTMFQLAEMLRDPVLRQAVDIENIGRVKEIPAALAEKFGKYSEYRSQLSAIGRMSRDLRVPFSAIERAFDSMDEIMRLVRDWTATMESLKESAQPTSPAAQTN
ncbi:toll/interleukin-1 receptor domain-containing protein [Mycobacterium sp. NPDC050441]|uniref:toll/interleukin-1 receptor domain-containing protein n=1 Tax=Mycobacterium sp. NPDC050441 TaxID=3155403 RepID=UPI0033DDC1C6